MVPAQPNATTSSVSVASTVVTAGSPLGIDVHLRDLCGSSFVSSTITSFDESNMIHAMCASISSPSATVLTGTIVVNASLLHAAITLSAAGRCACLVQLCSVKML
jgi:hypothetical protein